MFATLFGKKKQPLPVLNKSSINFNHLDESFHLLRAAASEVSIEAAKAARSIEDRDRRIKACFEALNSASDIIFIINANHNIYFCNDRFVEAFGLSNYDQAVDQNICDVVPGVRCTDEMWTHVKGNKTFENVVGQYRLTMVPMMNGVPNPIYYVCTMKPTINN